MVIVVEGQRERERELVGELRGFLGRGPDDLDASHGGGSEGEAQSGCGASARRTRVEISRNQ